MATQTKTRCKVICDTTGQQVSGYDANKEIVHTAKFSAVYSDKGENAEFFKWTPHLTLNVGTVKQPFEIGKEYYLDFTLVEED